MQGCFAEGVDTQRFPGGKSQRQEGGERPKMKKQGLLWTDKEIMELLRQGIEAEVYSSSTDATPKGEIKKQVADFLVGITPREARELCAYQIFYPEISLTQAHKNLFGGKVK